ncbi:MAG: alpha/beta hydrolase [cyanobacterium endosymbiont of Rhopalodia sterrenbergii]
MSLNAISIAPTGGKIPQSLLIMLHGWGANAKDLTPLASALSLGDCQIIFPNAPFPHPEVAQGRAWYVLESLDYQGLSQSQNLLRNWLFSLENQTGVPLSRTVLAGFSQGGAMSLDVGLQLPLAGICSLSGYLHFQPQATQFPCPSILIIHGVQDIVVPIQAARKATDTLTDIGAMVEYHEFNGGHEISSITLAILQRFIKKKLLN